MAIFFNCLCGQNLRVDEDRAGGFARCLACGNLAPVPALQRVNQAVGIESEASSQTATPVLPVPPMPALEFKVVEVASARMRPIPPSRPPGEDDAERPYKLSGTSDGDHALVLQRMAQKKLRKIIAEAKQQLSKNEDGQDGWQLEKHWYECLLYAVRALPMLAGLALAWATVTALFVFIMPARWDEFEIMARFPLFLAVFVLAGYTFACLQATLAVATAGEAGYVAWAERDLIQTARGGAEGLVSFLAGPIIPAAVAFFFWRDSGELVLIDWLILLELGILTVSWWALTLLAIRERGRFFDANPFAIGQMIQSAGYRAPVAALLGSVVVVLHGLVAVNGVMELHHSLGGWFLLAGAWAGQLFWMVFLVRWLGVSRFRARAEIACVRSQTSQ